MVLLALAIVLGAGVVVRLFAAAATLHRIVAEQPAAPVAPPVAVPVTASPVAEPEVALTRV